jgi:hypothetical protein
LEYNGVVHHLFINFQKAYVSVRKEVLYIILTDVKVIKKLVRLFVMCLNITLIW